MASGVGRKVLLKGLEQRGASCVARRAAQGSGASIATVWVRVKREEPVVGGLRVARAVARRVSPAGWGGVRCVARGAGGMGDNGMAGQAGGERRLQGKTGYEGGMSDAVRGTGCR